MPNMIQVLLPRAPTCQVLIDTLNHLQSFGNGPCIDDLPLVPMPYYDTIALLSLPSTPHVGFCIGLTCYAESIEAPSCVDTSEDEDMADDDPRPPRD